MPNRIIKESICTSESLNSVSAEAERLFYRLIVKCDDFGRFHGNPKVIRAECFPLRADEYPTEGVAGWLQELVDAGMVIVYATDRRQYLEITSWLRYNRPRAKFSKHPSQDECNSQPLQASASKCKQVQANDDLSELVFEHEHEHDTEEEGERAPIEEEITNLQGWGELTQVDREWVEQLVADYPILSAINIRGCRDWWLAKAQKHSKKQWKSRLRNWMNREGRPFGTEKSGGNNGSAAERVAGKYLNPDQL